MTHPRPPLTSSNPEYHLGTARFTTHQPGVLEQVGVHHAYARGLTGRGVRIGIDDTIVDYTQRSEFESRVKLLDSDGASLSYPHPFGDLPFSDVDSCQQDPACQIWTGNSAGNDEAPNNWARDIVSQDGWPTRDDSVFVLDEYYSEHDPIESLFPMAGSADTLRRGSTRDRSGLSRGRGKSRCRTGSNHYSDCTESHGRPTRRRFSKRCLAILDRHTSGGGPQVR